MFSSNKSLLTVSGIKKLSDMRDEVAQQLDIDFAAGSSDYSRTMVGNVLKVIDLLIQNNNIFYWKNESNRAELLKLIDVLDGEKGTFVPEVFNAQSCKLANIILASLENIKLEEDICSAALLPVKAIIKPDVIIKTMSENLKHKIQLYVIFINNERATKRCSEIVGELENQFTLLEAEAKDLTQENYELFKAKYLDIYPKLLEQLNDLPYARICNASNFVDAKKPYQLKSEDTFSKGNRGFCAWMIILAEKDLNLLLMANGLPLLTPIHDHYSHIFSQSERDEAERQFAVYVEELKKAALEYKTGDHLGNAVIRLFKSVNAEKVKCVTQLVEEAYTRLNDDKASVGIRAFDVFKATLLASSKNQAISSKEKISVGELSKLVNRFGLKFLAFSFLSINETNDSGILKALEKYEDAVFTVAPKSKRSLGM
jgi:hypothetical protein